MPLVTSDLHKRQNCKRTKKMVLILIMVLLLSQVQSSGLEVCPSMWQQYNRHCYKYQGEKKTFLEAQASCMAIGGQVISLTNDGEQGFVNTLQVAYESLWLRLAKNTTTGQWEWTCGLPLTWTNWQPNAFHYTGDCVLMLPQTEDNKWRSTECESKFHYVCKRPQVSVGTRSALLVLQESGMQLMSSLADCMPSVSKTSCAVSCMQVGSCTGIAYSKVKKMCQLIPAQAFLPVNFISAHSWRVYRKITS